MVFVLDDLLILLGQRGALILVLVVRSDLLGLGLGLTLARGRSDNSGGSSAVASVGGGGRGLSSFLLELGEALAILSVSG